MLERLAIPLVVLLMIGMIALVLARGTNRPATVIAGTRGTITDAQPSAQDVERARAALGEHGFIAFVACTMNSQTGQGWANALKANAEAFGLRFRAYDSNMDRYQQLTQLERAQLDGASALVVCALDTGVLDNSLAAVKQAGLPLVFTAPYQPTFGGILLDTDHYALGVKAGAFAGQILNDEHGGNVVVLTYPDSSSAGDRTRGILDQLQKVAPNARIVGTYPATTPDLAAKAITTLLNQGERIDVICTVTDSAASGAVDALKAVGLPADSVAVVSINGEAQARDLIRSGQYLRGSVKTDLATGAKIGVNAIVRLLAGNTVPETLTYAPGDVITRDNVDKEQD